MTSGLSSKQQVHLKLVTRHRRDEVGGGRREAMDSSSDMSSHLGIPTVQSGIQPSSNKSLDWTVGNNSCG